MSITDIYEHQWRKLNSYYTVPKKFKGIAELWVSFIARESWLIFIKLSLIRSIMLFMGKVSFILKELSSKFYSSIIKDHGSNPVQGRFITLITQYLNEVLLLYKVTLDKSRELLKEFVI